MLVDWITFCDEKYDSDVKRGRVSFNDVLFLVQFKGKCLSASHVRSER